MNDFKDRLWKTYFADDSHSCFAGCGAIINRQSIGGERNWDSAHVISSHDGGANVIANLRPVCRYCNRSSGTENLFAYMKRNYMQASIEDPAFEEFVLTESPIEPREIEPRLIRTIVKEKTKYLPVGVIFAATGCGKTSLAIEAIGPHLNGKIILWITEMKVIIKSQFTRVNIESWKKAGLVPRNTSVLFSDHLKMCMQFPSTCILAVSRSRALNDWRKIAYDERFTGFVIDECQYDVSGDETYKMLCAVTPLSEIRIGLTATPKMSGRFNAIFDPNFDGNECKNLASEPRFLLEYSIFEALTDGLIRWPQCEFSCVLSGLAGAGVENSVVKYLTNPEVLKKQILNIIERSFTRKGIIWCDSQAESEVLYHLISADLQSQNIHIIVDTSKYLSSVTDRRQKTFRDLPRDCVVIACDRYRAGVDIRGLSFGIVCGRERKGITTIIQCLGRLTRKEPFDAIFAELMVSADISTYSRDVKNRLLDYYGEMSRSGEIEFRCNGSTIDFKISNVGKIGENKPVVNFSFHLIDQLHQINLKFETEELMILLRDRLGMVVDYDYLKKLFVGMNMTRAGDIELYLEKSTDPDIARWWKIMRYYSHDWNKVLGLTGKYYESAELARRAVNRLLRTENLELGLTLEKIYENFMNLDNQLPPNPVGHYKLTSIRDIINVSY